MSRRRFEVVEGAQVITCARCGRQDSAGRHGGRDGGNLPPEAITRFFARRGWVVAAKTPRKDRCPECANRQPKQKEHAAMPKEPTNILPLNPPQPGASERPPRTLTRDDRRIIFAKLEDCYIDEKAGYSAGWNDERVAKELGVPRAWIEEVREQNFGPNKVDNSREIRELSQSIETFIASASALRVRITGMEQKHAAMTAEIAELRDASVKMSQTYEMLRAGLAKLSGE